MLHIDVGILLQKQYIKRQSPGNNIGNCEQDVQWFIFFLSSLARNVFWSCSLEIEKIAAQKYDDLNNFLVCGFS